MVQNLEDVVREKMQSLSPEQRRRVLDFVESLAVHDDETANPGDDLYGLWEEFNISVTPADLAEARREMWSNFPKSNIR
jgi:hypothetical protein